MDIGTLFAIFRTKTQVDKQIIQFLETVIPTQDEISNADGIKVNFPLTNTPKIDTEKVYLNGQRLNRVVDYSISSNIITFISPPFSGDIIQVEYIY